MKRKTEPCYLLFWAKCEFLGIIVTPIGHEMDILNDIATHTPVPAGGAAAAFTSCLAVALLHKVIIFELHREKNSSEIKNHLLLIKREFEQLRKDLEEIVSQDSEAYLNFYRSKDVAKQAEIESHFSQLMDVSMKVLGKSYVVLEWVNQLSALVHKQMLTHLKVACELLIGAINGTIHVMRANVQAIKHPQKRQSYLERLNELHDEGIQKYRQVLLGMGSHGQN